MREFVYFRPYRCADSFIDIKHPSVECIIAFASTKIPKNLAMEVLKHSGQTVWQLSSKLTEEQRFIFLAAIVWASVLNVSGDVICNSFAQMVDELEHYDRPSLGECISDCIRTCEAYTVIVGRIRIPQYFPEHPVYEESPDFANVLLKRIYTNGIWKLRFMDGLPVHELIIHKYGNKYRIVQSNVGKYTMAQFCFHWPKPPPPLTPEVVYEEYGLPYTENRTVSTKEQVVKFLNNVKSASDIPDFQFVELERLGNESL